jgi:hypothetical protein
MATFSAFVPNLKNGTGGHRAQTASASAITARATSRETLIGQIGKPDEAESIDPCNPARIARAGFFVPIIQNSNDRLPRTHRANREENQNMRSIFFGCYWCYRVVTGLNPFHSTTCEKSSEVTLFSRTETHRDNASHTQAHREEFPPVIINKCNFVTSSSSIEVNAFILKGLRR